MLTRDLFQKVLLDPVVKAGANRLLIVSGYATASMAAYHMERLYKERKSQRFAIDLVVGMTATKGGMQKAQHLAFRQLAKNGSHGNALQCQYILKKPPTHAKTYCWLEGNRPILAFAGSANYTMTGFGKSQIEAMEETDPLAAKKFFQLQKKNAFDCGKNGIENDISFLETTEKKLKAARYESVDLSLVLKNGKTPEKAGINWGQRPGRNKDQAYLQIPAKIGDSGFFPERYKQFVVLTDDGKSFVMVRAQDGGKGLHTTENNALLGRYLRERMGLAPGEYVTAKHLAAYGRKTVAFFKEDEETYFLDFKPSKGNAIRRK